MLSEGSIDIGNAYMLKDGTAFLMVTYMALG